ncbi:hypothetical protein C8R46DRAFT_1036003 [Mycena filopes]|nr:hypothetical protein C8R46DRAFT_1036003 [Mycena filopes]
MSFIRVRGIEPRPAEPHSYCRMSSLFLELNALNPNSAIATDRAIRGKIEPLPAFGFGREEAKTPIELAVDISRHATTDCPRNGTKAYIERQPFGRRESNPVRLQMVSGSDINNIRSSAPFTKPDRCPRAIKFNFKTDSSVSTTHPTGKEPRSDKEKFWATARATARAMEEKHVFLLPIRGIAFAAPPPQRFSTTFADPKPTRSLNEPPRSIHPERAARSKELSRKQERAPGRYPGANQHQHQRGGGDLALASSRHRLSSQLDCSLLNGLGTRWTGWDLGRRSLSEALCWERTARATQEVAS